MNDAPAYILCHPADSANAIAQSIVTAPTAYDAGKAAALTGLRLRRDADKDGALKLHPREVPCLDRLQKTIVKDGGNTLPYSGYLERR